MGFFDAHSANIVHMYIYLYFILKIVSMKVKTIIISILQILQFMMRKLCTMYTEKNTVFVVVNSNYSEHSEKNLN